jgi:DNA-binding NarL/FixJ family response regulator
VVLTDNTLSARLSAVDGITVVADGSEAVWQASLHRPDVVLLDVWTPSTITEVRQAAPGTAVLVFTRSEDDHSLVAALRAGARGYLAKDADLDDVVRAVRELAAGGAIFGPPIADRLPRLLSGATRPSVYPFPELASRERDVLELVAAGMTNTTIAARLNLAPKTIRNLISSIFSKMRVANRAEAIVLARESGLGRSA